MASQTIIGPDLQFTQDNLRCFAYTGPISAHADAQTVLDFTTGGYTVAAIFYFNGPTLLSAAGSGIDATIASITFDDIIIAQMKVQTQNNYFLGQGEVRFIIPPGTAVKVQVESTDTNADRYSTGLLTGRVYDNLPVRN